MHINVRDILVESVGYSRTYKVADERPDLVDVKLTQDIEGEITISRLDDHLLVRGQLHTEIELECHRCLSTFTRPIKISLAQEYSEHPSDEQMPIVDGEIDIAPLAGQEIILSLPIKILCRPDCPGIAEAAGKYTKPEDTTTRLETKARITKGTKRGRT
jgi:uncharacterized protein